MATARAFMHPFAAVGVVVELKKNEIKLLQNYMFNRQKGGKISYKTKNQFKTIMEYNMEIVKNSKNIVILFNWQK